MLKKVLLILPVAIVLVFVDSVAGLTRFGHKLCDDPGYTCVRVRRGETWRSLFPDLEERTIVQKINRMNIRLHRGMVIAIPDNLRYIDMWDISPHDRYIEPRGEEVIIVDESDLAWGAYDESGELQAWGPTSPGKDYCADVGSGCRTVKGTFRMFRKGSEACKSRKFPIGKGGSKMPYCMFFHRGYAMHGSSNVPGYRASHGCVRMFTKDAEWLNESFIDLPGRGERGTLVIIRN